MEQVEAGEPLILSDARPSEPGPATLELRGSAIDKTPTVPQLRRQARGLIGWMPDEVGLLFLSGNMAGAPATPEQVARIEAAHEAVRAREPLPVFSDVVRDAPEDLEGFLTELRASPASAGMFNDGWTVRMVDLTRVCAFQPVVFTDSAAERAVGLTANDTTAIARVTLPLSPPVDFTQSFDPAHTSWVLSSRNPNLRVLGNFSGPVVTPQGTAPGFGFMVAILPSFMHVAEFEGRHYLRDGYHRAFGLLSVGIHQVAAFVRAARSIEELVPQNMLPQAAYRGDRPPLLVDYLRDDVAAAASLPAVQKLITVHALELSPCG